MRPPRRHYALRDCPIFARSLPRDAGLQRNGGSRSIELAVRLVSRRTQHLVGSLTSVPDYPIGVLFGVIIALRRHHCASRAHDRHCHVRAAPRRCFRARATLYPCYSCRRDYHKHLLNRRGAIPSRGSRRADIQRTPRRTTGLFHCRRLFPRTSGGARLDAHSVSRIATSPPRTPTYTMPFGPR